MKIDKNNRICDVARNAADREELLFLRLAPLPGGIPDEDGERPGHIMGTDGYILANLPVTLEEGDAVPEEGVFIHGEALYTALKAAGGSGEVSLRVSAELVGKAARLWGAEAPTRRIWDPSPLKGVLNALAMGLHAHQEAGPHGPRNWGVAFDLAKMDTAARALRGAVNAEWSHLLVSHPAPDEPILLGPPGDTGPSGLLESLWEADEIVWAAQWLIGAEADWIAAGVDDEACEVAKGELMRHAEEAVFAGVQWASYAFALLMPMNFSALNKAQEDLQKAEAEKRDILHALKEGARRLPVSAFASFSSAVNAACALTGRGMYAGRAYAPLVLKEHQGSPILIGTLAEEWAAYAESYPAGSKLSHFNTGRDAYHVLSTMLGDLPDRHGETTLSEFTWGLDEETPLIAIIDAWRSFVEREAGEEE